MSADTIVLDLRDERGRFLCRPQISRKTYAALLLMASAQGISFEEVLHRAIAERAERVMR